MTSVDTRRGEEGRKVWNWEGAAGRVDKQRRNGASHVATLSLTAWRSSPVITVDLGLQKPGTLGLQVGCSSRWARRCVSSWWFTQQPGRPPQAPVATSAMQAVIHGLAASIWESASMTFKCMVINVITLLEESVRLDIIQTDTPNWHFSCTKE